MESYDQTIPGSFGGLRHLALKVTNLAESQKFYQTLFNMKVVWQPDEDNLYLSSGIDNLALHQIPSHELADYRPDRGQFLDHFGFIVDSTNSVDDFYQKVVAHGVTIVQPPKRHRDGSYSFYLADPNHITIQVLYEPTVSSLKLMESS